MFEEHPQRKHSFTLLRKSEQLTNMRINQTFIKFKKSCCTGLKLENFCHRDEFSYSYGCLKIAILTNLDQLTRDIYHASNVETEI